MKIDNSGWVVARKKAIPVPFIVLITLLLGMGTSVPLKAQVVGATLSGTVTDTSGAVIPKVDITIKNTATSVVRTASTNNVGVYSAPNLQAGDYEVKASAAGFASASTILTLTVGAQQMLNLTLQVGTATQTVRVSGAAPNVDLVESTLSGLNTEAQIKELPLNGRSWTDLAELQPGVSNVYNVPHVTDILARAGRGFGDQLSISGARPHQNNYRLDGVSINDSQNAGPGSVLGGNLGVDAISEFSVLTTNYSTEYGRASGGIINATTKSGTNEFHGDAYEFIRNDVLDSANFFDVTKPPFRRNQFGGSAGMPIKKDKVFIFGDYEGLRQFLSITQDDAVPSMNAREGILSTGNVTVDPQVARFLQAFYPLPNTPTTGDIGSYIFGRPQIVGENYFTIRSDQIVSDKDTLHETYMFDWAQNNQADEFNNKDVQVLTHNQVLVLDEGHIFSAHFSNDARFGVHRDFIGAPDGATAINPAVASTSFGTIPGESAAAINVNGLTGFSGGLVTQTGQLDPWTDWQGYDDAFYSKGIHSLKFGANIERIQWNRSEFNDPGGTWNFASLSSFLTNQPLNLTADAPNTETPRAMRQWIFGMYIQDDVRVRPNLTFNLGLRYEPATVVSEKNGKVVTLLTLTSAVPRIGNPMYQNNQLHDFDPRVGFAWDPFSTGKTSVRGGFGIYDQLSLPAFFSNPISSSPPFTESVNAVDLSQGDFPTIGYQKGLAEGVGSLATERVAFVQQHPGRAYVMQYNLSIERELIPNLVFLIGYVGNHGVHGITNTDDANIVLPIASPLGYLWPCEPFSPVTGCGGIGAGGQAARMNPNIGREPPILWRNSSLYDGLQVQLTKRISHGLRVQGSFAWQRIIDTASGNSASDQFINGISSQFIFSNSLQRGPADFNEPRVLSINALWSVPTPGSLSGFAREALRGWQIGGIFSASDGVPFTPLLAGDPLGLNSTDPFAYPDRLRGPGCGSLVNPRNAQNYLKVQCFAVTPAVLYNGVHYIRLGNAVRNDVYGPGVVNLDFSLVKDTYVTRISDTFNVQFRVEVFNIANRANFSVPTYNGQQIILDPTISGIGIVPANPMTDVISLDPLDSTSTPSRQVQFALKIIW